MLEEFWFVTPGALYHAFISIQDGRAVAEKVVVAPPDGDEIMIGDDLGEGRLIGIWDLAQGTKGVDKPNHRARVVSYTASRMGPPWDPPECVDPAFHRRSSGLITALFLNKKEAMGCLILGGSRIPWSPFFRSHSLEVIEQIGENHDYFVVSPSIREYLHYVVKTNTSG